MVHACSAGEAKRARSSKSFMLVLIAMLVGFLCVQVIAASAAVTPRYLDIPECPGISGNLAESGFAPGTYELSSPYATFVPSTVTVGVDTMTASSVTVDDDAPDIFDVDVTPSASDASPFLVEVNIDSPWVSAYLYNLDYEVSGGCFAPGDSVSVTFGDVLPVPPQSLTVNAQGDITSVATLTPMANARTATVTASAAGRIATNSVQIPATTLTTGGSMPSVTYSYQELYSPGMAYDLNLWGCSALLDHLYSVDGQVHDPVVWWAGNPHLGVGSCVLKVLTNGNLVLDDSSSGHQYWETGTEGSGTENRLVVQDDGKLVLYTNSNHPVWSTSTGLIRGPDGYRTSISGLASARSGSHVGVSGNIRQYNINGDLTPIGGRPVYLERLAGTVWNIYLAGVTTPAGHVLFQFQQSSKYYYRLYTPQTSVATRATSTATRQ